MVDTLTTIGGWSAVVAVGAGTWWYYKQQNTRNKPPKKGARDDQSSRSRTGYKENRRKEKGLASEQTGSDAPEATTGSVVGSENAELKQRKKDKKNKTTAKKSSAVDTTPVTTHALPNTDVNGRADADDRAFARQLQNAQEGTSLKSSEKHATQVRTLKQGKANRSLQDLNSTDVTESSTPPSTTGADADDDLSPRESPSLQASPPTSDPHGISDMLETPSTGPSTLRLVPSKEPQHQSKPKKEKPAQELETKRQRQRKAANEARKVENAEVEKQRRMLMEKQMKLARTAEGTAKSGQYRTYSSAPATNAWSSNDGAAKEENVPLADPFLDTFEATPQAAEDKKELPDSSQTGLLQNTKHNESSHAKISNGTHDVDAAELSSSSHSDDWENLQIRNLAQQEKQENGWQEVPTKKSKQGKKKAVASDNQ